ncbi:MAG TPA: GntR family transcriptional regulator [Verrucomicrobiae bacterium]|nr:GntR family transcriptional regulator [Verrucomicrobiae bacterium]
MSIVGPLDKQLPVPLYHQLHSVLKAEIEAGKWRPGEQIPTESNLSEAFGVSKITVRQALERLVELGYIRKEQGRGTFVSERKFDEGPRKLTSFTEEMKAHGLPAASRVLGQAVEAADARVAAALRLSPGSPVLVLRRLRLAGGQPLTFQVANLPADLVPGLEIDGRSSLYDVLQSRYHLYAARAKETYVAATADTSVTKLLGIRVGAPVFKAERISFLPNEKPFEFVLSTIRGDRYSIVLDLVKEGADKRTLELQSGKS